MANPLLNNNTTITFDNIPTPSGKIKIELVIHCGVALYDTKTADELGLIMLDVPSKKYDWDDREFWFGIGNCTLEVYDPTEMLEEAIRDINFDYEQSSLTITYKSDNSIYYKGYFDSDKYSKDYKNVLKLEFNPLTEKLARTPSNVNGTWNNVYSGKYAFDIWSFYNLKEFILDTLKNIIDSSMELETFNNWTFQSSMSGGNIYECSFDELLVSPKRLFGSQDVNFTWTTQNYREMLITLCKSLGIMIFFPAFNRAKVVAYLDVDNTNVYDENNLRNVLSYNRSKEDHLYKFIEIVYRSGGLATSYGDRTGLNEDNYQIQIAGSGVIFRVPEDVGISKIKRNEGSEFYTYETFLALYYGSYLTNNLAQIKDTFEINGLAFDIEHKLKAKNYLYFPLSIEYNLTENKTKIIGRPFAYITDEEVTEYPVYNPDLVYSPETENQNTPGYDNGTKVINELLYLVDGIKEYSLLNDYKPLSIEIFRNGQKLVLNVDYEETTSSKITFIIDIEVTDYIQANYEKLL